MFVTKAGPSIAISCNMADEDTIRRLVRDEIRKSGGFSNTTSNGSTSNNVYSMTQELVRAASSSAVEEMNSRQGGIRRGGGGGEEGGAGSSSSTSRDTPSRVVDISNRNSSSFNGLSNVRPNIIGGKGKKRSQPGHPFRLKPYSAAPPCSSKEKIKTLEVVLLHYNDEFRDKYKIDETVTVGSWWFDLIPNRSEKTGEG